MNGITGVTAHIERATRTAIAVAGLAALSSALLACAVDTQDRGEDGAEREVAVTAQALVGSCEGSCGGASPDGCWCDEACTGYGDCCDDFAAVCGDSGSCAGNCGGSAGSCYCDDACRGFGDCCDDYVPECRRRVLRMSAGGRQTCAQMFDGGVVCWGRGQHGVLGYASVSDVPTPDSAPGDVSIGAPVSRIVTGYYHTCALLTGGGVKCWGRNNEGQLGYPGSGDVGDNETPASMPNVNVGGTVLQLAAGTHHTCALLSGGTVKCWGSNAFGQLGYPGVASVTNPATAATVTVGGTANMIYANGFQTCARLSTGALRCWGDNSMGQLGYGINTGTWARIGDNETPASAGNVPIGTTWFGIPMGVAGPTNNCVMPTSGGVKCWGSGDAVLGDGSGATFGDDEPASAAPTLLPGEFLISIGSGGTHHCVLTALGAVKCWGYIPAAGLGYGSPAPVLTAAAAGVIDIGGAVSSISVGYVHVCATLVNGGARCWGQNGLHGYPISGGVGDDETPADMGNLYFP